MMIINNITPNKNIYKTNKLQFKQNVKELPHLRATALKSILQRSNKVSNAAYQHRQGNHHRVSNRCTVVFRVIMRAFTERFGIEEIHRIACKIHKLFVQYAPGTA